MIGVIALKKLIISRPYEKEESVLIVSQSHPFNSLKYIQKEDLYRLRFIALNTQSTIRARIEKTLIKNDIHSRYLKIAIELNSIEAIKSVA
jgi:DNA-binding transcriptional LysR family regulator